MSDKSEQFIEFTAKQIVNGTVDPKMLDWKLLEKLESAQNLKQRAMQKVAEIRRQGRQR